MARLRVVAMVKAQVWLGLRLRLVTRVRAQGSGWG